MLQELIRIAQEHSSEKRVDLLRRITDLYLKGLGSHSDAACFLFDDIMTQIVDSLPREARVHAAVHLTALPEAPPKTVRKLAKDSDIDVARPVLGGSTALTDDDLIELASCSSQAHLAAIATRAVVTEPVTDVLVERGERDVMLTLSANHGAHFSESGMSCLIDKARADECLQELLVERPDLSRQAVAKLLPMISRKLTEKLAERGHDPREGISPQLLGEVGGRFHAAVRQHNRKLRDVARLVGEVRGGRMSIDAAVQSLVVDEGLLEVSVLIGELTGIGRNQAFKTIAQSEIQPALILFRSFGLPWSTVDAILKLRAKKRRCPYVANGLDRDYEAIEEKLAQRVIRFLQVRQSLRAKPADERAAS